MGYLTDNPWVRYVDRTYQQIKDRVITALHGKVPELTDHTEGNPFVKIMGVWAGIAEMLGYYTDSQGRESFLTTARLYRSAIKHARARDYRVHGNISASVDELFILNVAAPQDILIPAGFTVSDGTNQFRAVSSGIISTGSNSVSIPMKQYVPVAESEVGSTNGVANQEIVIGLNVVDGSVAVTVGNTVYQQQETLAYSLPVDTHFVQTVNEDGQVIIRFGDGINGILPLAGQTVTARWNDTAGANGASGEGSITTIVDSINLPVGVTMTVTNNTTATGGGPVETLEQLQHRIPLYRSTKLRAVSRQDYADVAELYPGVAKAGAIFNCGKFVQVFIVPVGGGIASTALRDDVAVWMDDKKTMTTNVEILAAGEIVTVMVISLEVLPNYLRNSVAADVKARIVDFMSYLNQDISGRFRLGDLYEVIETTTGVKNSTVDSLVPLPYATPVDSTTPALNWTRALSTGSTAQKEWQIVMTDADTFQLFKENAYIGTYDIDVTVTQPEIQFKVSANGYSATDSWKFVTYPYDARQIDIVEPSVLVTTSANITINATGGL